MREIKFRAWDGKLMIYTSIIGLPPYENFAWPHGRSFLHNCEEWSCQEGLMYEPTLLQYTGLKDKNGKEIYEGDIIKLFAGHSTWISTPFAVVFQSNAFAVKKPDKNGSTAFATYFNDCIERGIITDGSDDSCLFEIIGNIYENPELL